MPDINKEKTKISSGNPSYHKTQDVVFYDHLEPPKRISISQVSPPAAKKAAPPPKKTAHPSTHKTTPPPHGQAPHKKVKKKKRKFKLSKGRIFLNTICCILAVMMIITGTGCIVMYSYLNRINFEQLDSISEEDDYINPSAVNSHSVSGLPKTDSYNGTLLNDPMILNIMLFGADTRKGATVGQSDTMILFSIDTRHKKLKMLSFMRDTYVDIPGYESQKLNASYTFGGASLAVSTIERNYGIQIDRYAVVNFKSFKNIIDALGGIDIDLTEEEIDYIDWQLYINNQADTRYELDVNDYTFRENDNGEKVATVHLNGQQALWHARNRGEEGICSGDDYVRTQRQRNVVSIIINDLKKADFSTVLSVIYEIGPMVTTNLKTSEITKLASNATKYLQYDIVSQSAPLSENVGVDFYYSDWNNPVYVNGEMVDCIVIVNWNEFRQKVAEFVFEEQVQ